MEYPGHWGTGVSIHTVYCSIVYANISLGFHSQYPQAVFSLPFIYSKKDRNLKSITSYTIIVCF